MTEERKYQEMLQRIRGFRLFDDDFMTKCFEENIEATELVLRIVLNKSDIKVIKVQTQYSIKNIKGRSLRLDIYATDSENKKYNEEVKNPKFPALSAEVSRLKETEGGAQSVCAVMERYERMAVKKDRIERIIIMIEKGCSKEFILELGYTEDEYCEARTQMMILV